MPSDYTLIAVPTRAELRPIVRRLGLQRRSGNQPRTWTGMLGAQRVEAVLTGVGPRRAALRIEAILSDRPPSRLLIAGTAGGANPTLCTADILTPARVVDAKSNQIHEPTVACDTAGVLYTVDHIITDVAQKHELYESHGVDAVDMETASIALVCRRFDVPWLCVRAILDTARDTLPADLGLLTMDDGRVRIGAAALYVLRHPGRVRLLRRLGRDVDKAMCQVAEQLLTLI